MQTEACIRRLKALADETRWGIVRELLARRLSIGQLTAKLSVPQSSVSKHVRILREARIVVTERAGKNVWCGIADDFRQELEGNRNELDLGCCVFRFDKVRK